MRLYLSKVIVLAAAMVLGSGLASANLIISPTFDSTINNDANAAAIKSTINTAIAAYESAFTNPITVLIYFQEGGGLGQSNTISYFNTYTSFYNGLVANNANPDAIAGLNANGGNASTNGGVDPVSGTSGNSRIAVKSADGRALGLSGDVATCIPTATGLGTAGGNIPNSCVIGTGVSAVDAIVSLNTAITNPGLGNYSLLAVTEHEIDEVLGLGSALRGCNDTVMGAGCTAGNSYNTTGSYAAPEDLYRYDANGNRTLSTTCSATPFNTDLATQPSAFFAYGSGTGNIAQFNNDCNGGDFGDWQSSPLANGVGAQVQDAFTSAGTGPTLGPSEITALTAIGYTSTDTPEPGTVVLFGAGFGAIAIWRRRSAAKD